MPQPLKVDLFTDVVCPWCLIGSHRLDRIVEALAPEISVEIENHPFYLDPDAPPEGVVVADILREKYGREPEEMWARVEAEAAKSGIKLDLSRQPRAFPTTKAHTLTRLAKARGTQHALANAIADAYFLQQREIQRDDVLSEIASAHGFTPEETIRLVNDPGELEITAQQALQAARMGISGVPFFILDNRYALSGAQPEAVLEQALRKVVGEARA